MEDEGSYPQYIVKKPVVVVVVVVSSGETVAMHD